RHTRLVSDWSSDVCSSDLKFRTDLGTLESGRTYSLLFELRLPETTFDATEVGHVVVKVPGVGGPRTYSAVVSVPRTPGSATPDRSEERRVGKEGRCGGRQC